MKLLALLSATVLLVSPTLAFAVPPAPDVPNAAIGVVQCGDRLGTFFRVGTNRLVTAAHVTSHAASCSIGGKPVQVVREDGNLDVAELRSDTAGAVVLSIDCGEVRRGGIYRAIGFAAGRHRTNLPLIATGEGTPAGQAEFVGETIPGMSGGPVIDQHSRVAAVINTRLPASARSLRETWLCGA